MRILSVTVDKVGGLPDGRVELPAGSMVALAGANGTGKSKLLACILAPWTGQIPSPRNEDETATVTVELKLTSSERHAIDDFSAQIGWGEVHTPEVLKVGVRRGRIIGFQKFSEPNTSAFSHCWDNPEFLTSQPSLNVIYLPAERRLMEPRGTGIDLGQLNEMFKFQKGAESRQAVNNYGRLDDQEFEDFAKALCVAASLPADDADGTELADSRTQWEDFQQTVNALIAPKELLSLTRSHPDELRIRTPNGGMHSVRDLSSGERQALIIVSRVLRSSIETPIVLIDEPDAYLHPNLSRRLILALEDGVGADGQLIVATHSPAVLDGVQPSSILRLEHDGLPRPVADESERLQLYREAGFRSSALTQSDLLLITEGATDASILILAIPDLGRASLHSAGGRAQVLRSVEHLKPFDLPIIGVVDRDLNLTPIPNEILDDVFVWPTADIEGVYLDAPESLQVMIDHGMIKADYATVERLVSLTTQLCEDLRENVIAEIVRAKVVSLSGVEWPSPKGNNPIGRLREAVTSAAPISGAELEDAIQAAELEWNAASPNPLSVVRGKYILRRFVSEASEMKSGLALIEAVARHRPAIPALTQLSAIVSHRL